MLATLSNMVNYERTNVGLCEIVCRKRGMRMKRVEGEREREKMRTVMKKTMKIIRRPAELFYLHHKLELWYRSKRF